MKILALVMMLCMSVISMSVSNGSAVASEAVEKPVMQMPEGVDMHTLQVDGFKITFHIMNMPVYHRLMKSMGVNHSDMERDTSHHIMVELLDNKGEKVGDAAIKIKVVDPRDSPEEKALKPMKGHLGQYGADFRMIHRGKYRITAEFKTAGKVHRGNYTYEIK